MSDKNPSEQKIESKISRRSLLGGMAAGAIGAYGFSSLKEMLEYDSNRIQLLHEFSVDNFWYTEVDKDLMVINNPLKGSHKADIVIIGGGFTGLSTAYHLIQRYPNRKIVLLEGAYCGFGASGRNGGHHGPNIGGLMAYAEKVGPELGRKAFDVTMYGDEMIREFATTHGIDCDYHNNGKLKTATSEEHIGKLLNQQSSLRKLGIESELLQGTDLVEEINSPRFVGGLKIPYGGRVNPAKLVRGMKRLVERMGVEIKERTMVRKLSQGKTHLIETELGTISAPIAVLAVNSYAHSLGFFKSGMFPVASYNIATEPLKKEQIDAIGWKNGRGMSDCRVEFDYQLMTNDNRIVIGGAEYPYYANDGLSSGNNKRVSQKLEASLFTTFPQLKGTKIDYKWGGTCAFTYDKIPSVGVMGEHKNIYYAVGYCGHGVAFAHTAARIMTDLIAKEKSEFTDFYLVNRALSYSGPRSARFLGFNLYKALLKI
jgi:gamma-glutamylputrescine oxidase